MPLISSMIARKWWSIVGLVAMLAGLGSFSGISQTGAQADTRFVFTAHGDHGAHDSPDMLASLAAVADSGAAFSLALGDMSYEQVGDEQRWCETIQQTLGTDYPFEVLMGNHEDEDRVNGYIGNFVRYCPDRMRSQGIYGAEYFFDYPASDPLLRVIMLGAGNDWDWNSDGDLEPSEHFDYKSSSPEGQAHINWLVDAIDSGRAAGIPWIVVGMHKNCLSVGKKGCEIGTELLNLLLEKHVDLILQGHDHTYQRTKQLALSPECKEVVDDSFDAACVADAGTTGSYTKGAGTIIVVTGHFGAHGFYAVSARDPEKGYFAKAMGGNGWIDFLQSDKQHSDVSRGFIQVAVSASQIDVTHIATTNPATSFADRFSIVDQGTASQVAVGDPSPPQASGAATEAESATSPMPPENNTVQDISGLTTLTLTPLADAYVDETNPDSGRGRNVVLRIDASPMVRSYLQFDMQGTQDAVITRATLRVYANSASNAGYNVQHVADTPWSEADLTPGSAPALGEIVGTSGAFEADTWTTVDVTSAITGDDLLNLALTAISNTAISFSSRQGDNPPELVLEFSPPDLPALTVTP